MKSNILFLFLFVAALDSAAQKNTIATITISNKSNIDFNNVVVEIPWSKITSLLKSMDTSRLIVLDVVSKKQIMFQLESIGTDTIQHLLVQVSVEKNKSKMLRLSYGERRSFPIKTYGRFVPERKEDFAWENDQIAFRMYGKELEKTPKENAYGMDVWVKRTDKMIINERYKRGEYHIDHGDGMDYYHVGFSLGAGNSAPFVKDSIYYSKNYVSHKVLDNGPLRTSFQLFYDAWDVAGMKVSATKTITLDAGAQLNKFNVKYSNAMDTVFPTVVGIIRRKEEGVVYLNEQDGIMGYWEPVHGVDGTTGVGCLFPYSNMKMKTTNEQFLATTKDAKSNSFVYYTGAVWDKANKIHDANEWINYLNTVKAQIDHPMLVDVK